MSRDLEPAAKPDVAPTSGGVSSIARTRPSGRAGPGGPTAGDSDPWHSDCLTLGSRRRMPILRSWPTTLASLRPCFNVDLLEVRIPGGGWRDVVDRTTGTLLGSVSGGRRFELREPDGRRVIRVHAPGWRKRDRDRWGVRGPHEEEVGWILPGTRLNKRGRSVPIVGPIAPLAWAGWIRFADADADVAHIANGMVVDVVSRRVVAELSIGKPPWWRISTATGATWSLRLHDCSDRRLRLMALGWLGVAFHLQEGCEGTGFGD
jgi:hypothetical protein